MTNAERAGVGQREGVVDQPLGVVAAALDPVAAEGVLALRGEPMCPMTGMPAWTMARIVSA